MQLYEDICEESMHNKIHEAGYWASLLCDKIKKNKLKGKVQNYFKVNSKKYIVTIKVKVEEVEAWQVEEAKQEERKSKRKN